MGGDKREEFFLHLSDAPHFNAGRFTSNQSPSWVDPVKTKLSGQAGQGKVRFSKRGVFHKR
jgi:hypothetical protein